MTDAGASTDRAEPSPDAAALELVRRRVVNVVGHELRTPLTTIRGLAELLIDAADDEREHDIVPALVRSARRAERLLDDLLIAAGVITATPTTPPETVDLVPIAAAEVEGTAVALEGSPPGRVSGHRDQVRNAIGHLVTNADRYHDGPPVLHFETGTTPDGAAAVAVVVTTPVASDVPNLDLAFELFFRGEVAVMRSAGLGIGLPVARALARMDGGDVTIESRDGAIVARLVLPEAP